jgi:hypothetical protein
VLRWLEASTRLVAAGNTTPTALDHADVPGFRRPWIAYAAKASAASGK